MVLLVGTVSVALTKDTSMRKCADWIDSYLKLNGNTEPPTIFHKWAAVSCIASCMQRKCVLPWGELEFYPNLYIILVGPPAVRKGTAMGPIMRFLEEPRLNIKLAAESLTREQLIKELVEAQEIVTMPDGKITTHASLTICNSELTVFLGYQNIQLMADLTDWYDCKRRWRYRTKNSGHWDSTNIWVNMLGATTTELLRMSLPAVAIGGGLTSRMLFIYAGKKKATIPDPFITQDDMKRKEDLLDDLEQIITMCGEYRPTIDYIEARTEWYMTNDGNPPFQDAIFARYCDRRIATASKLSIIMAASHTNNLVVTGDDFMRGIALIEEAEQFMPMALSGIGTGKHADVMARLMIEVAIEKECTLDTLMWKFRSDVTHWEMERLIQSLEAMNYCVYVSNTHRIIYNTDFNRK